MTLIEVLVALAILGLAAVGLAATHGNLLLARETMRRLDEEDEALRLARERVLAADATGETATVGKDGRRLTGRVELASGGMADWEATIVPEAVGDLFAVTLTVRNEGEAGEGRSQSFHLTRPSWSSETDRRALLDAARERLRTQRGFEATVGGNATGGTSRGSGGRGSGRRIAPATLEVEAADQGSMAWTAATKRPPSSSSRASTLRRWSLAPWAMRKVTRRSRVKGWLVNFIWLMCTSALPPGAP